MLLPKVGRGTKCLHAWNWQPPEIQLLTLRLRTSRLPDYTCSVKRLQPVLAAFVLALVALGEAQTVRALEVPELLSIYSTSPAPKGSKAVLSAHLSAPPLFTLTKVRSITYSPSDQTFAITLNDEGAERFDTFTRRYAGQTVVIKLGEQNLLIAVPPPPPDGVITLRAGPAVVPKFTAYFAKHLGIQNEVAAAARTAVTPAPQPPAPAMPKIMGATKAQADAILQGWPSRESNRSSAAKRIYYYTKDVDLIVTLKAERVVGVSVVDRPGAGGGSISEVRLRELVDLIGLTPAAADVKRDSAGIHEFHLGET